MDFETRGISIVRGFLSKDQRDLILNYLFAAREKYRQTNRLPEGKLVNDEHHPNTFSFYSPLCGEVMLLHLLPFVERITGQKLIPSFSYARTYYKGSNLDRHTDRARASIGITVCLEKSTSEWPLIIIDKEGLEVQVNLDVMDAVIFKGMELEHYRNELKSESQTQIFFFYVLDGEDSYFDGRDSLGFSPKQTGKKDAKI